MRFVGLTCRGASGTWLAELVGEHARLSAWVDGRVQGVGYRYWIRSRARDLGLRGSATNLPDGRVAVVVQGPRDACQSLLEAMDSNDAPGWVGRLVHTWGEPAPEPEGFRVG